SRGAGLRGHAEWFSAGVRGVLLPPTTSRFSPRRSVFLRFHLRPRFRKTIHPYHQTSETPGHSAHPALCRFYDFSWKSWNFLGGQNSGGDDIRSLHNAHQWLSSETENDLGA